MLVYDDSFAEQFAQEDKRSVFEESLAVACDCKITQIIPAGYEFPQDLKEDCNVAKQL